MIVLAIFMLVTNSSKKVIRIPYIYYFIGFQENQKQIKALFNSSYKIYAMNLDFAQKLDLYIWKTNIVDFQIEDKASRSKKFLEIFLVANTKFVVILEMLFLNINNVDVFFDHKIFI